MNLLGNAIKLTDTGEVIPEYCLKAIEAVLGPDADTIREQCAVHMGYAGNNYLPFLPPLLRNYRKMCLDVLEFLQPCAAQLFCVGFPSP